MGNARLKKNLLALELEDDLESEVDESALPSEVEVFADSLQQALEMAAHELQVDLSHLDYEIVEKGSKGIMGVGRLPYKVVVRKMAEDNRWSDLEDLNVSLEGGGAATGDGEDSAEIEVSQDGKAVIRVYKDGIFVKLIAPKGAGKAVTVFTIEDKIKKAGVLRYDKALVEKAAKANSDQMVKIGEWVPKPEADSTLAVEVAADEMSAVVSVSPPRPGGRHLKVEDVVRALKASNVVFGFQEEEIEKALDDDRYGQPIDAALGQKPKDGEDAHVDYKVRIDKTVEFKEDESGRVDFLAKDLVENVVQGQILAELIPEEKGVSGRTVTNRILPAKDGKPIDIKPGKGTILSGDGRNLIAERNGQAVFTGGRLTVEEVYTVGGDVGLDTGNIMFLGSVQVRGSVTDNMQVKAAGNIEVGGNVQKAHLEAEGDIIIRQGVQGRDDGSIESTTGSVYSKFVQSANVSVGKDIIVSEAIMHSKVDAGGKVVCNGKRAQIVGGELMAGEEVRCKQLGSAAGADTKIVVGTNPKILQQINQIDQIQENAQEKLVKIEQNIRTLTVQKNTHKDSFSDEKEEMLVKMLSAQEKLQERIVEAENEKNQLKEYIDMLATNGKVHVEKTLFPGVTVEINGAHLKFKDEYQHVTLVEDKGNIKILPYEESEENKKDWRKRRRAGMK